MKSIAAGLLAILCTSAVAADEPYSSRTGLGFVGGLHQPEDILQIGTSRWIIASGMDKGGGISLIDAEAGIARPFYQGRTDPDPRMYPDCVAPDLQTFNTHGLALFSQRRAGLYRLYAVSHFPFEAIHVFRVDARGKEPAIAWTGCVKLPDGHANAVTVKRDGTILADMTVRGDYTNDDFARRGIKTGGIYAWSPVTKAVRMLPGTELRGNNGIEISRDETQVYVAVPNDETVAVFDLADTARGPRLLPTPGWRVDNIHWSAGRLIAAGKVPGNSGWRAAALDPVRFTWADIAGGVGDPEFGGVTTALLREGILWLGSYQEAKVARLKLDRPRAP